MAQAARARTRKWSIMAKSISSKSISSKHPKFAEQPRVVLPGSEKAAAPTTVRMKAAPAKSKVTVSVIVKRKTPLKINRRGGRSSGPARVSPTEFKKRHSADPDAMKIVRAFARQFNLKVEADPASAARRTLQLTGTVADMQKAFGVELKQTSIDGTEYRVREGGIHIPSSMTGVVEAVLGLDNRPQAKPHFRVHRNQAAAPGQLPRLPKSRRPTNGLQMRAELDRPSESSSLAEGTGWLIQDLLQKTWACHTCDHLRPRRQREK